MIVNFFKFFDFLTIIYFFILIFLVDILDLIIVNEEFYVAIFLLIYFFVFFYFLNSYIYVFLKNFYFLLNIFEFTKFLKVLNTELLRNLKYFFLEFLCWYHCFRSLLFRLCLVVFKLRRSKKRFFFNSYNFFHFFLVNLYFLNILKYFINFFLFYFYLKIFNNFKNYSYFIYFFQKTLVYENSLKSNVETKESISTNFNLVINLLELLNNFINSSYFFFNNINLKKKIDNYDENEIDNFSDFFIFFPYLIDYKAKYTHNLSHNFLENSLLVNFFFYVNKYIIFDNLKKFDLINKFRKKEFNISMKYLKDTYTYFMNYNEKKIVISYYTGVFNFNVNFDYNDIIFRYFKLTFFDKFLRKEKQFILQSRLRFYFLNSFNFFNYDRKIFFSNFYYNEIFDYKNYDLKEYFFFFVFKKFYLSNKKFNVFPSLLIILRDLDINKKG
jgi:hypothetical protein